MNFNTTDASPNEAIPNFEAPQRAAIITADVLKRIQLELEEFEKVAILFLIGAEFSASYSRLLGLCCNSEAQPCIVSQYINNDLQVWSERLIEALCIIGNHEVLRNLGYSNPSELSNQYQASIPRFSVTINKAAKVLYKLFETLDTKKTEQLLQSIYKDGQIKRHLLDTQYLELHALHWLQERFIRISPDGSADLSNLLKHLKQLGYYTENIYHDVASFSSSPIRVQDAVDSCSQGKPVINKRQEPISGNDNQGEQIKLQKKNMPRTIRQGVCLIINEVEFAHPYKRRDGSDSDVENLRKTFTRRNFRIQLRENLNKNETKQLLREVSDDFDVGQYDCLVVCILSHGYEGGIVTCDGLEISNQALENEICTDKLRNTIKLLIVQACQGKNLGDVSGKSDLATDGPRELTHSTRDFDRLTPDLSTDGPSENILRFNHFCRFMSTMDRFVSIRHVKSGSWFIEAVCQELNANSVMSLSEWELNVKHNVQRRTGNVDGLKTASQIPEFNSRLHTLVYFPPFVDNEATEAAGSAIL